MNERIQELAYQAEDYADSVVDQGGEFHPAYTRKLAELIIQDCISTIENAENGYRDYRNQIEDRMRDHCVWLIKQKFGVEE